MEITPLKIAFAAFSVLTVGGGLGVVTSRNLIHAALFLIVSLFGVAGYFVLLEAPFLAAVQVLIYIGAIAIIIIFAVMLTRGITTELRTLSRQWIPGLLVAIAILVTLGFTVLAEFGGVEALGAVPDDSLVQLGKQLVDPNNFVLPFEVASVLLLGALIGSVAVARE
jgi:NADH-quinone oxidoreductase subunit J